jgi:PAS domain S-box-containing protein
VTDATAFRGLLRTVTRATRLVDVWPVLHEEALRATGASTSVLLRLNTRSGELVASSAIGLDDLDHQPWMTSDAARAAAERAWAGEAPVIVTDAPEVIQRLGADAVMVVPVAARDARLGLLLLGISDVEKARAGQPDAALVGELVALTLDRSRLENEASLQYDIRFLVSDFSRAVSSSLHLGASLELFCERATRLFATDKVAVWLHDRRAHAIELVASSDAAELVERPTISADEPSSHIALVMRATRAALAPGAKPGLPRTVLVPLRGRRRALGTLVIENVRFEMGNEFELLDRVEEVGRQLSGAIENLWLLEDVLRSRRELENTVNSLADIVVVTDSRSSITHSNAAFAKRLGRRSQEILGRPLSDFFAAEVTKWVDSFVGGGSSWGHYSSQELHDSRLGGTFVFTVSPLVGRDEERIGLVMVARDITDKSRHEAERIELRSRLTQSEKLAALGQFVAGIAHELNNPLQGVLGHLELMLHEPRQLPPRAKRDLKLVFREADRAAKIVHNLLVFAGSRRIARRRLNVNLVITRALSLRATACSAAGIEIVKNLTPKLPRIAGDPLLLQQTVLNIVLNAEQALASVTGKRRIEVSTAQRDNSVELRIADTGPGIPKEVLPRLFEPFFTTKEVGKGTGLGLAIAYGIVQEHGGQLHASNRREGGAVFTVELPSA